VCPTHTNTQITLRGMRVEKSRMYAWSDADSHGSVTLGEEQAPRRGWVGPR